MLAALLGAYLIEVAVWVCSSWPGQVSSHLLASLPEGFGYDTEGVKEGILHVVSKQKNYAKCQPGYERHDCVCRGDSLHLCWLNCVDCKFMESWPAEAETPEQREREIRNTQEQDRLVLLQRLLYLDVSSWHFKFFMLPSIRASNNNIT